MQIANNFARELYSNPLTSKTKTSKTNTSKPKTSKTKTSKTKTSKAVKEKHLCLFDCGGSPWGFGEQGNTGKISKGTREHEPNFRKQGNKT